MTKAFNPKAPPRKRPKRIAKKLRARDGYKLIYGKYLHALAYVLSNSVMDVAQKALKQ